MFASAESLTRRGTKANALLELGYDKRSRLNPVPAGDTLYAALLAIEKQVREEQPGIVRFKPVVVMNKRSATLLAAELNCLMEDLNRRSSKSSETLLARVYDVIDGTRGGSTSIN